MKCERCREREKRIEELRSELAYLERLVDECESISAEEEQ